MKDSYKTIENASEETLFKDRNSKFFGYAFPVLNEDDVKNALEHLKKKHHTARHFCYAWQLGIESFVSEQTTMESLIILQACQFMGKFKHLTSRIY